MIGRNPTYPLPTERAEQLSEILEWELAQQTLESLEAQLRDRHEKDIETLEVACWTFVD